MCPRRTRSRRATRRPRCSRPAWPRSRSPRARRQAENPSAEVSYYGYDNDTLNPAGSRRWSPRPRHGNAEAQKTEPDKNTYLVFERPAGRRPGLRLRHALPVPGPRGRRNRRSGLHHADQPRRRRRAPRHAAGHEGLDRRPDRDDRRLDLGSVGPAAAVHDRERERADLRGDAGLSVRRSTTSPAPSAAAATRASRTTPTATSGSSRTSAAPNKPGTTREACRTASSTATCRTAGRPRRTASCRCCRS